jgi:hypothetical protein
VHVVLAIPVQLLPHMSFSARPCVSLFEPGHPLVRPAPCRRPGGDLPLIMLDMESWVNIRRCRVMQRWRRELCQP